MKKEDRSIEVISFQKESEILNLQTKKEQPMQFDFGMLYFQISEMKAGFIPKKIFKTTKKGTKVTFVPMTKENVYKFKPIFTEGVQNFIDKWRINPIYELFPELKKGGDK